MEIFNKLITKYAILYILSYLLGYTWVYLKYEFIDMEYMETYIENNSYLFWLPDISNYLVHTVIAIVLFFDIKKNKISNYLIPIGGLFYPLFGICMLLITYCYKEEKAST